MILPEKQTQQESESHPFEHTPPLPFTNKKSIAAQYGVCVKTLRRWLKEENVIIPRGLIRPCEQALIHKIMNQQRLMSPNVPLGSQKKEH
jgi:abortive infection bacteriophage resistance protein